jgi:hypothetical protein
MEVYLIILITSRVVLPHTHDKVEHSDKGADSIWVTAQHDIAESDVVVCRDMARCYTCKRRLGGCQCF